MPPPVLSLTVRDVPEVADSGRKAKVTHLLKRRFNYDFGAAAAVRPRPLFLVDGEWSMVNGEGAFPSIYH